MFKKDLPRDGLGLESLNSWEVKGRWTRLEKKKVSIRESSSPQKKQGWLILERKKVEETRASDL